MRLSQNFCFLKTYSTIIKFLVLQSLTFDKDLFSAIISALRKKKCKFMKNTFFPEQYDLISDIIKGASRKHSANQGNVGVFSVRARTSDQRSTNNKAFSKR